MELEEPKASPSNAAKIAAVMAALEGLAGLMERADEARRIIEEMKEAVDGR